MEELFVPIDLAIAAKKLGFDEPCFVRNTVHGTGFTYDIGYRSSSPNIRRRDFVMIPTWDQLIKWFRDVHDLWIWIELGDLRDAEWYIRRQNFDESSILEKGIEYTYDEARLISLEKAFTLI